MKPISEEAVQLDD